MFRQKPMVKTEEAVPDKKKVIRPEIWRFARAMEEAMKRQDRERGDSWTWMSLAMLESRLACNFLKFMETRDKRHLIDVANYAMMTYQKSGKAAGGSNGTTNKG